MQSCHCAEHLICGIDHRDTAQAVELLSEIREMCAAEYDRFTSAGFHVPDKMLNAAVPDDLFRISAFFDRSYYGHIACADHVHIRIGLKQHFLYVVRRKVMSGEHADPPELLSEVSVYLKRRVYPDPFFCCVCLKIKRPGKRIAVDEKVLYPIRYSRIEDLVKTSSFISFIRILESDLGVTGLPF